MKDRDDTYREGYWCGHTELVCVGRMRWTRCRYKSSAGERLCVGRHHGDTARFVDGPGNCRWTGLCGVGQRGAGHERLHIRGRATGCVGCERRFWCLCGDGKRPAALVIAALDAAGNSYPAYVSANGGAGALGTVALGGCEVVCGLPGQQQSSAPVTISGSVTTDPVTEVISVVPQYALLTSSGAIWSVVIPTLNAPSPLVTTAAGGCAAAVGICAAYQLLLPSTKPVVVQGGVSSQASGSPVYAVAAAVGQGHTCTPMTLSTVLELNGSTSLTGNPGAALSAATLAFHACS